MSRWFDELPFRIGTSSYIIPDDILPNVRYLADKVKDIELVLFDIDEYCNIPDAVQIAELKNLAAENGLSYTVHLPLNLSFSDKEREPVTGLRVCFSHEMTDLPKKMAVPAGFEPASQP